MTEAVTPPPSRDPFGPPVLDERAPDQPDRPAATGGPAVSAAEIRDGAAVALLVGVAGVLLGLLWVWLSPRLQYVSNGEAVFLKDTENEARIGSDGTFLLLSAGLGALSAVATFLWRRAGGVPLAVGLGLGSVFAALVGWRLGLWLGPSGDVVARAKEAGKGVPFDAPLELLAYGVLLAWPMAAVAVHLALTALFTPQDPAPEPPAAAPHP
ncbi:hypothetical protein ABZY31_20205 [Streptomyces sp. NPDC006529]|uniref:hypothetical protein n=1 Tax=Streptomyces sp. NPDC006529 TaxID=3157177 RepID=UPI0033BF4D9B